MGRQLQLPVVATDGGSIGFDPVVKVFTVQVELVCVEEHSVGGCKGGEEASFQMLQRHTNTPRQAARRATDSGLVPTDRRPPSPPGNTPERLQDEAAVK